MGDDYDSGDDLFEGVTDTEFLQLSQPRKRPREAGEDDQQHTGSFKNEVDDATLTPTKRPRPTPEVDNDPKMRLATKTLEKTFGYSSFRHEQQAAIRRILDGENTLAIFPTGAGKSLCYQVSIIFPYPSSLLHSKLLRLW